MVFGWVSLLVMVVTTVIAFYGYVLLGVQLLIWWFFQLTLLQTVSAVYDILNIYYEKHIRNTKLRYIEEHPDMPHRSDEDMIAVTWPHAFIKQALLPVAIVVSIPLSIYMASGVFDLTGVFKEYFLYPFLNVEGYISLSFYKIVTVLGLYFIFSFLNYFIIQFIRCNTVFHTCLRNGIIYIFCRNLNKLHNTTPYLRLFFSLKFLTKFAFAVILPSFA